MLLTETRANIWITHPTCLRASISEHGGDGGGSGGDDNSLVATLAHAKPSRLFCWFPRYTVYCIRLVCGASFCHQFRVHGQKIQALVPLLHNIRSIYLIFGANNGENRKNCGRISTAPHTHTITMAWRRVSVVNGMQYDPPSTVPPSIGPLFQLLFMFWSEQKTDMVKRTLKGISCAWRARTAKVAIIHHFPFWFLRAPRFCFFSHVLRHRLLLLLNK